MSRTRYQRIRAAYLEILHLDAKARPAALDRLDAELRDEVATMLDNAETVGILDRGVTVPGAGMPATIGPYRVLERLGQGGMGDVFLAAEEGELSRQVAVKRIPSGSRFLERFATERKVLAQLRHPNIAVVYDAGDDGQHAWLAMEYIAGQPVDRWVRENKPDLRQRVALVRQICAGVNHAHQRGILHRDLKPGNLLVGTVDGQPNVRVIDFGIAKVLDNLEGLASGQTMAGQLLGTPQYMAPEQTELQPELIDTRSDTYAIGIVLYELVSGQLPHPPVNLAGKGLTELRQILLNTDPPHPSRHDPRVDRELDWICGKALARDPDERYQSARELSEDLERWLEGRPVHAAPPGAAYRARKFAQRHKLALGSGALILVLLVAGLLGTSLALLRARKAESLARHETQRARQTSEFLLDLFDDADPTLGGSRDEIAEWILTRGRDALGDLDDPDLRRTFTPTMGRLFHTLGLYDEADTLLVEALVATTQDPDPAVRARAHYQLGLNALNRGQYDRADTLLQQAAILLQDPAAEAPELRADVISWQASLAIKQGHNEKALVLLDRSQTILENAGPGHWFKIANNFQTRSIALRKLERPEEALAAIDTGLSLMEEYGADHRPAYAAGLHSRANALSDLDRPEESLADFRRSRAIWIASFGEDHPHVVSSYSSQSAAHYYRQEYAAMEELVSRAMAIQERLTSREDPMVASLLMNRSVARLSMDKLEGVEEDLRRALGIYEQVHGGAHHHIASALDNLAFLLEAEGRETEALDTYRRCAGMREQVLGPDSAHTLLSRLKLAEYLDTLGRRAEAVAIARDIQPALERKHGPDHDHSKRARDILAEPR